MAAVFITLISLLNFGIYWDMQFDSFFERTLKEAYSKILWKSEVVERIQPKINANPRFSIFLIACRFFEEILGNVRDLYVEFFFIVGIVTLWAISCDFKSKIVKMSTKSFRCGNYSSLPEKCLINQYIAISKLSRLFSKAYGYSLLSYFLLHILYFSIGLDRIFIPLALGEKFYELEFIVTICLIYGLGAHYSLQVCMLKLK